MPPQVSEPARVHKVDLARQEMFDLHDCGKTVKSHVESANIPNPPRIGAPNQPKEARRVEDNLDRRGILSPRNQTVRLDAFGFGEATLATPVTSAVISVSRYFGVEGANPIGNVVFGNTNGVDGACAGGTDDSAYQFDMSITRAGGMVFWAIALRNRKHNPGNGYTERDQVYSGSGGSKPGIAIQDRLLSTASNVLFAGTQNKPVDWAVVALELRSLSTTGAAAQTLNLKAAPEAVNDSVVLPERFSLLQNYPNPFNAETTIECALPVASNGRITIFNLKGQTVRTLVDEYQEAGIKKMKWDGRNNLVVGSDIYLLRAENGGRVFSRKIVLQK